MRDHFSTQIYFVRRIPLFINVKSMELLQGICVKNLSKAIVRFDEKLDILLVKINVFHASKGNTRDSISVT